MSQRALAHWTGTDPAQVNRFLNGKERWPLYKLSALAGAFGLTLGEFLEPLIRESPDKPDWKHSGKTD